MLKSPAAAYNETTKEVAELKHRLAQLEAVLQPLRPIVALMKGTQTNDPALLLEAASLIDALSSEVEKRLQSKRQVIVYNVPDKIPAEKAKQAILMAAG